MTPNKIIKEIISDENCIYDPNLELFTAPEFLSVKIINLCDTIGIRLLNLSPKQSVLWDGVYLRHKEVTITNILHEVAHFQIAKSHHRYKIDFGLGRGPESSIILPENKLINKFADVQEEYASVLGILWCKFFEIKVFKTFVSQGWNDLEEDNSSFRKILMNLKNRGFASVQYRPTLKESA